MKVHYINILLFALPLNILINEHRNHNITTLHKKTNRSLCECELYAPANYDNDPQMKKIMENFNKQTQQRFHEYDNRMKTTRQKCKDQCDKEIQKIILKDKLEKELMDKFATLDTDIQSNAIPTCICEKSIADKVEKGCLRCGGILGSAVPELGAIGGSLLNALNAWHTEAIAKATVLATEAAKEAATKAGMEAVRLKIKGLMNLFTKEEACVDLTKIVNPSIFDKGPSLVESARNLIGNLCMNENKGRTSFYTTAMTSGDHYLGNFGQVGATTYQTTLETKTPVLQARYTAAVDTAYGGYHTSIIAPIIAIVIIVLIMVIIYLILRRRRKKKMKKKLQYIKLLEE